MTHIHAYTHTYSRTHTHTHTHRDKHTLTHTLTHVTNTHTHTHTHKHTHTHTHIDTHTDTQTHAHTHTHTHTHNNTHTHTHTHTNKHTDMYSVPLLLFRKWKYAPSHSAGLHLATFICYCNFLDRKFWIQVSWKKEHHSFFPCPQNFSAFRSEVSIMLLCKWEKMLWFSNFPRIFIFYSVPL